MKRRFEVLARFWVQVDNNDDGDNETTEEQFLALATGDARHLLSDMVSADYEDYEVVSVKPAVEQKGQEGQAMGPLSREERQALIEHLKVQLRDWMFGDNQEEEYVMSGFPLFKGLSNMTDMELLLELGHHDEGDSDEQIVEWWRREMIINEAAKAHEEKEDK